MVLNIIIWRKLILMQTRILLTGGSGFIGKNVIEFFNDKKEYVVIAPSSFELNCISEKEVCNYLRNNHIDIVLNFALYHTRIDKNKDESLILQNNLHIYYNFAKHNNLYKKMIYLGSGAEYNKYYPIIDIKETDLIDREIPTDNYGMMKYIINQDIEKSSNIYNLILFGLYGKYEDYKTRFISSNICRALLNHDLSIRKNTYFSYLYISDFLNILLQMINKDLKFHSYNIVPTEKIDLLTLANIIRKRININLDIVIKNNELDNEYTGNNDRILSELVDINYTSFDIGIGELIDYYKSIIDKISIESIIE